MICAFGTRLCVKRRNVAGRTARQTDLRQPKIQNLGVSALGHKQVCGLDVAVDYAFCVCRVQRVGNLDGKGQNQLGFHRSPSDAVFQRQPVQKLHGDEGLSVLLADVVDRADVGVIQCRGRLGFALEAG